MFHWILSLSLAAYVLGGSSCHSTAQHSSGDLTWSQDSLLRIVDVYGTPYERGLQHGRLLKEDIGRMLQQVRDDIRATTEMSPDSFITAFLQDSGYEAAMQRWTPDLLEELRGISEGSGAPYPDLLMHQLTDEYWCHNLAQEHHCSSLAIIHPEGHATSAQTLDVTPFYHGFQTAVRHHLPDGSVMTVIGFPGHLGTTGMRAGAVSVNVNSLLQLDWSTQGLPVTAVVRGVLAQTNLAEAEAFVQQVNHASGQHYLLAAPNGASSWECSAGEVVNCVSSTTEGHFLHTNHPLSCTNYSDAYKIVAAENEALLAQGYPCARFPVLEASLQGVPAQVDATFFQEVLQQRSDETWDVISNDHSFAGVVYQHSATPALFIAPGKPHEVAFIPLPFQ